MNKKILLGMALACSAALVASAQQPAGNELSKEITLDKDFVPVLPVEKSSIKKKSGPGARPKPKVKKVAPPSGTSIHYSDATVAAEVPAQILTMDPYGYRTLHTFSDKRRYLEVGGGTQANFTGSAGYRIVDKDSTILGAWVQHNSTWAGKNNTPLILVDDERAKQVFNDNRLGLYFRNNFNAGTLRLDAGVHFDSFNYYGANKLNKAYNTDDKQSFLEFDVNGSWNGGFTVRDSEVAYRAGVGFNHAGYNMVPMFGGKGLNNNVFNMTLGGDYILEDYGTISLDVRGDYVTFKRGANAVFSWPEVDFNYFNLTVSPRYKWENEVFRAQAGVDLIFGDIYNHLYNFGTTDDDTKKFHIAPVVNIDVDFIDGASLFVDLKGGNTINSLSRLAALDRYSNPFMVYSNLWRPIDGEAGFKLGPFGGFSGKLFMGYAMSRGPVMPTGYFAPGLEYDETVRHTFNTPFNGKMRGFKFGVEANYKFRSLLEASASVAYAPGDDVKNFNKTIDGRDNPNYKNLYGDWLKGYALGIDGARLVGNFGLKVTPMRQLAIEAGVDYRAQRYYHFMNTEVRKMDDVINLTAGASWRFDKMLTLWAKGSNLLNRRYDILPGQGAQRLNVMAGVSLVF